MRTLKNPSEETATTLNANSGYNCRFCPHLDLCPDGIYAVDIGVKQSR